MLGEEDRDDIAGSVFVEELPEGEVADCQSISLNYVRHIARHALGGLSFSSFLPFLRVQHGFPRESP